MEKQMVNKKEVNLKNYMVYEIGHEMFIEIVVCYFCTSKQDDFIFYWISLRNNDVMKNVL